MLWSAGRRPSLGTQEWRLRLTNRGGGITLVGEPTGGGWYGNSGIIIPDVTLPYTKVRVRIPLYKMVQVQHGQPKGSGIMPDVLVSPSYDAILKGYDKKLAVIRGLIGL